MISETLSRLRQYVIKASFSHGSDRQSAMLLLDELQASQQQDGPIAYRVIFNDGEASKWEDGAPQSQDLYDVRDGVIRSVECAYSRPAELPNGEPVAWMFRWDYDHGNGWCRNAIRFVERMEHVWHEDRSTWRDIKPLYDGPVDLAQIIEQQKQLIASLRRELVESYSIGAIRPPQVPKSECPACLGDSMFGCDACIPDFSPGNGNRARRRIQAIEKGCSQPQAHPARCGCKDGNE